MVIISNDFEQKIKMLRVFFGKNATYFLGDLKVDIYKHIHKLIEVDFESSLVGCN